MDLFGHNLTLSYGLFSLHTSYTFIRFVLLTYVLHFRTFCSPCIRLTLSYVLFSLHMSYTFICFVLLAYVLQFHTFCSAYIRLTLSYVLFSLHTSYTFIRVVLLTYVLHFHMFCSPCIRCCGKETNIEKRRIKTVSDYIWKNVFHKYMLYDNDWSDNDMDS